MNEDAGRISIDLEELMIAMQTHNYEMTWLLDLHTGDVILAGDGMVNGVECDLDDFLDNEPERFRMIESIPSSKSYRIMEAFVDSLPLGQAQNGLRQAIEGSKPFRRFKDALLEFEVVRDQWFEFERQAYKKICEDWLESEEIEAGVVFQRTEIEP